MRLRYALVLVLLAFLVGFFVMFLGCSGNPAPAPTPPAPVPAPAPVPIPPPQTQPAPPPQTQTAPAPTDRVISHVREISYGQYAIFGDPTFDPVSYASAIAKTHFTKVSLHIRSPWNNTTGTYDVTYFGTAYDLGTWNSVWYDWLDSLVEELWKQGITVEICFLDQYSDPQWQKFPAYPKKRHPFQNNTVHKTWSAFTVYQNWNKGPISKPTSFSWLQWSTDAQDHVLTAKPTSALGRDLMPMITRVAARLGVLHKKHPKAILHVRLGNEPWSQCQDHFQNCEGHLGLDPRVEDWTLYQFVNQGFVIGKTLRGVKGDMVYNPGTFDFNLDCTAANYRWCVAHDGGWIYEIHGVDIAGPNKASTIESYIKNDCAAHGVKYNPALLDLSTDGLKDAVSDAVSRGIIATTKAAAEAKASDVNAPHHGNINQRNAVQISNADKNVFPN